MKFLGGIKDLSEIYDFELKNDLINIQKFPDVLPDKKIFDTNILALGFYKILFIKNFTGEMQVGNSIVKHVGDKGELFFVLPGEKFSCRTENKFNGYMVNIDSAIFKNYLTERSIDAYKFFSYDVKELISITNNESKIINFLMKQLWSEFHNSKDSFSMEIILSYIGVLLHLLERYYSRQFIKHKTMCSQLVSDFFGLLKSYYLNNDTPNELPSVSLFSEKLSVTPNYLGDSVKYHTGESALTIIHDFIIDEAKLLLKTSNKSISEISYSLGFEYPAYFSRLFKKKSKVSPSDYRKLVKINFNNLK